MGCCHSLIQELQLKAGILNVVVIMILGVYWGVGDPAVAGSEICISGPILVISYANPVILRRSGIPSVIPRQ